MYQRAIKVFLEISNRFFSAVSLQTSFFSLQESNETPGRCHFVKLLCVFSAKTFLRHIAEKRKCLLLLYIALLVGRDLFCKDYFSAVFWQHAAEKNKRLFSLTFPIKSSWISFCNLPHGIFSRACVKNNPAPFHLCQEVADFSPLLVSRDGITEFVGQELVKF